MAYDSQQLPPGAIPFAGTAAPPPGSVPGGGSAPMGGAPQIPPGMGAPGMGAPPIPGQAPVPAPAAPAASVFQSLDPANFMAAGQQMIAQDQALLAHLGQQAMQIAAQQQGLGVDSPMAGALETGTPFQDLAPIGNDPYAR